ncbi:MAG: class I fructose-bisphosphate aldolase [Citrobacter freundii]|nr:MAG: class I fructose-bisphosphate aldolase [Citrobacter freundii]
MTTADIMELIGPEHEELLTHRCTTVTGETLHLPSAEFVSDIFSHTNRNAQTLRNLSMLFNHGRLSGSGYLSILPVDQGVEHSAGASFAANPGYFDPEKIIQLAMEGGCNGVASTIGNLAMLSRRYAHRIPFIVKLNHNELLTYPNKADQVLFGSVREAWNLGAAAIGATIYFGSAESSRQIVEVSGLFEETHALGMVTILWCYLRNKVFKQADKDLHLAADLTGQANYLGATIQADIIKQKLPENNGGYNALNSGNEPYGKMDERMYSKLSTLHPIDLCRYQVLNCYNGRVGLINSGGASKGKADRREAIITAIINKRAGGMGLIAGRKAFQCPTNEGIALLHEIQDVYLNSDITIA